MVCVQGGSVCWGKIVGEENHFAVNLRKAGFLFAAQFSDNAIADVTEVGDALRHHATSGFEHGDELGGCCYDGIFSRVTTLNVLVDGFAPATVTHHTGCCIEHFLRSAISRFRT